MTTSVIIPVFNERGTIAEVIRRVKAVPLDKEIIVVDDGSTDSTWDIVAQETQDPRVRAIRLERNMGKGAAVRAGVSVAGGDIIVVQDADLELFPEDLPRVVQPILDGRATVVYGSRFLDPSRGIPWPIRAANAALAAYANALYGSSLTDVATAYKAVRADVIRAVGLRSVGFEFCAELTGRLLRAGQLILEVPVRFAPRTSRAGKKVSYFRDGLKAVWSLTCERFRRPPPELRRPLDRFDKSALLFIGTCLVLLLAAFPKLLPSMSDTWFHLAIADRIVKDGAVPLWSWWEYAPWGRPNLYPPLLHLILALLARLTGSTLTAGQVCAATFLPLALLTAWYCARFLFDSRVALLAVLLMALDFAHFVVMEAYIAGCLINILMPLFIVAFLSRRAWQSIFLLTAMYYSHLGFPHMIALGVLLFGALNRQYLRLALKVVGISFLWFAPWLAHVLHFADWIQAAVQRGGMPGTLVRKVLSLQMLNLVVVTAGLVGLWKLQQADRRGRLLVWLAIGFLPILFTYGGRYMMHTLPLWAMAGAFAVRRILPENATRLRIAALVGVTLLPTPSFFMMRGLTPVPFTTMHGILMTVFANSGPLGDRRKSERYEADCEQVAAWLRKNTAPQEVVFTNKEWVADMVSLLSDRATDFGAWWECSKRDVKLYNRAYRDSLPSATLVCIRPENDAGSVLHETEPMPGVDLTIRLGRFVVGRRFPKTFERGDELLGDWSPLSVAGAVGRVGQDARSGITEWTFRPTERALAAITAQPPDGAYHAVEIRLRSSDACRDMVLGVVLKGGTELRWPLTVPAADVWQTVVVPFAWMNSPRPPGSPAPVAARPKPPARVVQVYISRPPARPEGRPSVRKVLIHHVRFLRESQPAR